MKSTGIVRRVDDLGRIVIPKEIRKTIRIKESDPLEIYTGSNGEIIFKKYAMMEAMIPKSSECAQLLAGEIKHPVIISDRDTIIAASGAETKMLLEQRLSPEAENLIESRKTYSQQKSNKVVYLTDNNKLQIKWLFPIISNGDIAGALIVLLPQSSGTPQEAEILAQFTAKLLGKQIEY